MSHFPALAKLDRGEYVSTKNLCLDRFVPAQVPFVLESVITPDELLQALCGLCAEQEEHYREIVSELFRWSRFDRMIYLMEDQLYNWKHGNLDTCGLDLTRFQPMTKPLREVYRTYERLIT